MGYFDSYEWGFEIRPRGTDTYVVDDLQVDPDEKPGGKLQSRIALVARRQKIASLIGTYVVTTHVEGAVVAVDRRTKRAVPVLWSARRVLVLRGSLDEAAARELAGQFRADVVVVPQGQNLVATLEARFGTPGA